MHFVTNNKLCQFWKMARQAPAVVAIGTRTFPTVSLAQWIMGKRRTLNTTQYAGTKQTDSLLLSLGLTKQKGINRWTFGALTSWNVQWGGTLLAALPWWAELAHLRQSQSTIGLYMWIARRRENTTISGGYSMFDNIIEGYVSYKSQNTHRLRGYKRTYTGEQLNWFKIWHTFVTENA